MISVIIPPVSDCFMPTLGAAQITAYLKQQGITTKLYDMGAEFQRVLLQEGVLVARDFASLEKSALRCYATITSTLFSEESIKFMISYDSFSSSWNWREPTNIEELLSAHKELLPYIARMPSFSEVADSAYAAFSISFESQLIPALLIAVQLRKVRNIPIIFGGSFFYNYENAFIKIFSTLNIVDCLIIGPGELILASIGRVGILDTVSSGKFAVCDIFGKKLFRQGQQKSCPIVYMPDFTDLEFSRYFSTVKAFPYMLRNICYYGRCKFCNGDRDCGIVQIKELRKAFRSMSQIAETCNIHNVYIVDAGLSPRDFRMITEMEETFPFEWIANARFEKALEKDELIYKLRQKGCRMLRFGLESGSQRILNLMNKGTDVSVAASILQKLHIAGILTHVYLMFGYFGENSADREETLHFLERNRYYIDSYSVSIFQPIPRTPVYEEILTKFNGVNSRDAEEEYQLVLSAVYPCESEYQDILKTVDKVKRLLMGYAHTNAEFYSANIFSAEQLCNKPEERISIQFMPL